MTTEQKVKEYQQLSEEEHAVAYANGRTTIAFALAKTAFQRDALMNQFFGNKQGNKFAVDWEGLKRQFDIFMLEVDELREGIETRDMDKVLDGLGDTYTVIHGMANVIGVDQDEVHKAVHESNMTKYCRTQKELDDTVAFYKSKGISVAPGGEFPFGYVKTDIEQEIKGQLVPAGKFLKCTRFQEPDFSNIMLPYPDAIKAIELIDKLDLPAAVKAQLCATVSTSKGPEQSEQMRDRMNF